MQEENRQAGNGKARGLEGGHKKIAAEARQGGTIVKQ
jgi:hypothetical protein